MRLTKKRFKYALKGGAAVGNLEDTPEYKRSIAMRPACDKVLCKVFNVEPQAIERIPRDSKLFVLDQEFAIDLRIRLNSGAQITAQEKTLSYEQHHWRTFTTEFLQNTRTNEKGEFFKIASQLYLHGYSDESGSEFIEWHIFDMLKLMVWLGSKSYELLDKNTKYAGPSNASFINIKYDMIPPECFYASYPKIVRY